MYKFIRPVFMGFASWGLVVLVSVEAGSEVVEEKSIASLIVDAEQGDPFSYPIDHLVRTLLLNEFRLTSPSPVRSRMRSPPTSGSWPGWGSGPRWSVRGPRTST